MVVVAGAEPPTRRPPTVDTVKVMPGARPWLADAVIVVPDTDETLIAAPTLVA